MSKAMRLVSFVMLAALFVGAAPQVRAAQTTNLIVEGFTSGDTETNSLQGIVDTWNKAHADTQVKLNFVPDYDTTLAKDLASGNPPDVLYVDSSKLLDLVQAGALAPVGDKMDNVKDFYPSLVDVFSANGKFYCPPKDFSTLALEVNSDMLAKANVKPPTTWDELAAAAKALTTSTVAGLITPADPARWFAFLYQAGGSVTDANFSKMTVNSPEGVKALQFYSDLYTNGYAKTPADVSAGWPGEAFEKGKAAMVFEGNWIIGDIKKNAPKLKFQTVELPAGPKGKATMVFSVCYGVAAKGKNVDAATKFVNYLTGAEAMQKFTSDVGVMPARQSLRDAWLKQYPDLQAFLNGTTYAHRWGFTPGFTAVTDETNKQIQLVFGGSVTPGDALKDVENVGNQVLAKNGGTANGSATMAATMASTMSMTMSATMAPTAAK